MPKLFYEITSLEKANGKFIATKRWVNEDSIKLVCSKDCFKIVEEKQNINRIYYNNNISFTTGFSREIIAEFCNYIIVTEDFVCLAYSIKTPTVPSFAERKPLTKEVLEALK